MTVPRHHLPLAIFSALILPFVAVWAITQGPNLVESYSPSFIIENVELISVEPTGLRLSGTTLRERHTCINPGSQLYVSARYRTDTGHSEFLTAVQLDRNIAAFAPDKLDSNEKLMLPDLHVLVTQQRLNSIESLRLMIPCSRALLGDLHAYTNAVELHLIPRE